MPNITIMHIINIFFIIISSPYQLLEKIQFSQQYFDRILLLIQHAHIMRTYAI